MNRSTFVPRPRRIRAWAAACALGLLALPAFAPAAQAQSRDVQQLIDRVDRLERELGTVQRQAFGGKPPAPGAAAPPPEGSLAQIQVRLSELEGVLAAITGRLEELTFQNQSLQNRLDKLIADVDFRLRALEGGAPVGAAPAAAAPGGASQAQPQAGVPAGAPGAAQTPAGRTALTVPPPAQQAGQPPAQAPAQPGQAQTAAPPPSGQPGVLGTLTQADLAAAQRAQPQQPAPAAGRPATQTAAAVALPAGPPKDQYEFAYNLLRQRNYADAESAFRQFVTAHKTDELSGNAYYWLGETHYVRRQFEPAAVAFLEGYKGFPKGQKAADNLLKLGMSLAALNRQGEACTTFARLTKEFPDAPGNLKAVTENERKKLSCPG
jgi:tol-pal system protein YbgF